jgi:hypothetical protein
MLRSIGKPNAGVAAGRENGLWTASLASLSERAMLRKDQGIREDVEKGRGGVQAAPF